MTRPRPRGLALTALTAPCLLLAACSSGSGNFAAPPAPSSGGRVSPAASSVTSPTPARSSTAARATSATHPPAAGGGSACSLVTEQEATAAIGADPGKGRAFTSHGATQCQYGDFQTQLLLVNVLPSFGNSSFQRIRSNSKLRSGNVGFHIVDVGGVGDQALDISGPHTDSIYFTKGDALVLVSFSTEHSPPKGAALALAKIAAGRM